MKIKFNHKATHIMDALTIKDVSKSKKKLEEVAKQASTGIFPSFSALAEVISLVLSKKEILLLATKEVLRMSKEGKRCNCPACEVSRILKGVDKDILANKGKIDHLFEEMMKDIEKDMSKRKKERATNPISGLEDFLEEMRKEMNKKENDGPKMDEVSL